jgi:hypothetical protein
MSFENKKGFDVLEEKWDPVINHSDLPEIQDSYKRKVTAALLENQQNAMQEQALHEVSANNMGGGFAVSAASSSTGNLQGYDPVLISLVRRAMPNLMAYDLAGVQPMNAPTGLIFAMKAKYDSQSGKEALYQEALAKFSGAGNTSTNAAITATGGIDPTNLGWSPTALDSFRGMLTTNAENLGNSSTDGTSASTDGIFREMAFSIERVAVEARTRALKAEYTTELAQDLKAVHGIDAESELANILSTEILSEINRELMTTIYLSASSGAQQADLLAAGSYDLASDSDGRWSAERFRGLMFQIEREANHIAKATRRGKGNFVICSSDVASALAMGGFLNLSPAINSNLDVDDTGNTFVGTLNGKIKVYIDPYTATNTRSTDANFCCVGYRGTNPYDAGLFYCPYVPLQMVRAVGENTFQPKIGFKTRYGMVQNPFGIEGTDTNQSLGQQNNLYYRLFTVENLHGNTGGGYVLQV